LTDRGGAASPIRDELQTRNASRCAAGTAPRWIEFLHAFDVDFLKRRLVFLIQAQNRLYATLKDDAPAVERSEIDALKRELYQRLNRLRLSEVPAFHSSVAYAEPRDLFGVGRSEQEMAALDRYADRFAAAHEAALTRLIERLAADIDLDAATGELDALLARLEPAKWSAAARREVLLNYVGFPFWDVRAVARRDELARSRRVQRVRVDRLSPADARTLARLKDPPTLRGTAFLHFGAFFSRAFRENDYLLGRLHAIDRIVDIVCDSAGADAVASIDV
jgi:hypothetical protein